MLNGLELVLFEEEALVFSPISFLVVSGDDLEVLRTFIPRCVEFAELDLPRVLLCPPEIDCFLHESQIPADPVAPLPDTSFAERRFALTGCWDGFSSSPNNVEMLGRSGLPRPRFSSWPVVVAALFSEEAADDAGGGKISRVFLHSRA